MIALDLAPLVLDPGRGVSRALRHLLAGLAFVPRGGLAIEGFLPPAPPGRAGRGGGSPGLDAVHTLGEARPRPGAWRRALAAALPRCGARVLLSPWVAFPRTPVPVVAWVHEVPFARHGALEGALRTLRHRRALARAVERAAALVVPSHAVRDDLLSLHPDAAPRTHVVPHGFEVPAPATAPARGPGALALLVGTGRGAAGPRKKGVDVFDAAFAAGPIAGLTPVVVGEAPGLSPGVRVVAEIDDAGLGLLLADARVLVVPSRSEGFGYPVLEGFAAGVPVIASAAGALPEVSGGAAQLVPPGDAGALREAIERVATDAELWARMRTAGLRRAQEFPVEAMARAWLRVLARAGGIAWHG